MKCEIKEKDGAKIVVVNEDHITVTNVREFRKMVQTFIDAGSTKVILNLKAVKHIDSMGLGAIVGMSEAMKYAKGQLVILNVQYAVRELFRLTEMDKVLSIVESE